MRNARSLSGVSKLGYLQSQITLQASIYDGEPSPTAGTQRPLAVVAIGDTRLATFLDRALADAGYRVQRTSEPLSAFDGPTPEVVLLDPLLGLTELMRARTDAPMVVLSTDDSVEARVAALDAGADDVVPIPFELKDLLARLRAIRRGRALATASASSRARHGTLAYADIHLDLDSREVTRGGRRVELRNKAFELLACFMRHPQRVLSRRELLEDVWGYEFLGDSNVIEVTVSTIRQALEARGEPRLIFTVRPIGYILNARHGKLTG